MKAFCNLQNRFAIAADRILLSCDKQHRKLFGNFIDAFRVVKPADQFKQRLKPVDCKDKAAPWIIQIFLNLFFVPGQPIHASNAVCNLFLIASKCHFVQ